MNSKVMPNFSSSTNFTHSSPRFVWTQHALCFALREAAPTRFCLFYFKLPLQTPVCEQHTFTHTLGHRENVVLYSDLVANLSSPAIKAQLPFHIDLFASTKKTKEDIADAKQLETGCTACLDTLLSLWQYEKNEKWNDIKQRLLISFVKDTKTSNS